MKLGIFDSGLGGVQIASAVRKAMPSIDILYLGDTLHIPYGNRSSEAIYTYTQRCMDYMFREQNCRMIIMACNTASATALRRLQQTYLPDTFPERRVLGVVVPTIEHAIDKGYKNLGLIGTNFTISSNVYEDELRKINPQITIHQVKTPLLVPLIEHNGERWLDDVLDQYIKPLLEKNIEAILLGCTHYVCLKERIQERYNINVISQDDIVPPKLELYFDNHPEIYNDITRQGNTTFLVSDLTQGYAQSASNLYGENITLAQIDL